MSLAQAMGGTARGPYAHLQDVWERRRAGEWPENLLPPGARTHPRQSASAPLMSIRPQGLGIEPTAMTALRAGVNLTALAEASGDGPLCGLPSAELPSCAWRNCQRRAAQWAALLRRAAATSRCRWSQVIQERPWIGNSPRASVVGRHPLAGEPPFAGRICTAMSAASAEALPRP